VRSCHSWDDRNKLTTATKRPDAGPIKVMLQAGFVTHGFGGDQSLPELGRKSLPCRRMTEPIHERDVASVETSRVGSEGQFRAPSR
jgi:hypothetical protein